MLESIDNVRYFEDLNVLESVIYYILGYLNKSIIRYRNMMDDGFIFVPEYSW